VFLAVQVLDGVGGSERTAVDLGAGEDGTATAGEAQGGSSPVDGARAAACAEVRGTIETVAEAYRIVHGEYPADLDALLDFGLVRADGQIEFQLHVEDDELVVVGTGACAGS
jgi:hypothetical protein